MKNIKGKVTALVMIILAAVLNIGLLLYFDLSLRDKNGFVQSNFLSGSGIIGITTGASAIFWLLFIGNYWGFLTGSMPTEKKQIYRKGVGSGIIFLGAAIAAVVFTKWGISSSLTMHDAMGTFSLCVNAFGILFLLLVKMLGIGWENPPAQEKKERKPILKIAVIVISLLLAGLLELIFIYTGKGTIRNTSAAVGKTIIEPNIDFALWAIFWLIFACTVLYEKIPIAAKLKALTIALWIAIIAYVVFYILKFYMPVEPGPISAVLSCWAIFGIEFTINARAHLKE